MPSEVQPTDLVLVQSRGRVFYARVLGMERFGPLSITALDPAIKVRTARLADLREHWSHQGDPRPATPDGVQATFDHLLDP